MPSESLLDLNGVKKKCAASRTFIYNAMRAGTFPKPIKLSAQSVRWVESEVNQWVIDTIDEYRSRAE